MANNTSEYGGSDTSRTHGVQPPPHEPLPYEVLRAVYREDPDEAPQLR